MFHRFLRSLQAMEFEDRVLHSASLISLISLFFPWLSSMKTYENDALSSTGFGFRTGYIGHSIFLLQVFLLLLALIPLFGGPALFQKTQRIFLKFTCSALSTVLLLSCFSILLRVTFEVSNADIRFGIYLSIIGSFVATLYAFLRYEEHQRSSAQELFHHPDEAPLRSQVLPSIEDIPDLPPPPVPSPPPIENH
jgi:hypothetical protein